MDGSERKDIDIEIAKALVTAQYTAIRDEMNRRIALQHQLISFTLAGAGALLLLNGPGVISATALSAYPIVGALIMGSWLNHHEMITGLGKFIELNVEDRYLGQLIIEKQPELASDDPEKKAEYKALLAEIGWENYSVMRRASSSDGDLRPRTGWLKIYHLGILFLLTSLAVVILIWSRLTDKPEEYILFILDVGALILIAFFTLPRQTTGKSDKSDI